MGLPVGQRQRRAPRAAEHQPALDAEHLAQALDVLDQQLGRVVAPLAQRGGLAGAALVEQDDAVGVRVEKAAVLRRQAGARAAVQEDDRNAVRVADLFPVDGVDVVDRQHAVAGGQDRREQRRRRDGHVWLSC